MRKRQLTVPTGPSAGPLAVQVAPGYLTSLTFDVPLARDGVKLEGPRQRLARWEVTERHILLEPAAELPLGEPFLLRVRFADGLTPEGVTLALVTHPAEVDAQVTVLRQRYTTGELLAELNATRAQLDAARQELLALRTRCAPASLGALILASDPSQQEFETTTVPSSLTAEGLVLTAPVTSHRLYGRLALMLKLRNQDTASTWTPGLVQLHQDDVPASMELLSAGLDRPRLAPGEAGVFIVELHAPKKNAPLRHFWFDIQDAVSGRTTRWETSWGR
jgi:uncharacterized protein (TIGR02268 family)